MKAKAIASDDAGVKQAQRELPAPVYAAWIRGDVGAARMLLKSHQNRSSQSRDQAVWEHWQGQMGPDAYPLWVGLGAGLVYVAAWGLTLWAQNF